MLNSIDVHNIYHTNLTPGRRRRSVAALSPKERRIGDKEGWGNMIETSSSHFQSLYKRKQSAGNSSFLVISQYKISIVQQHTHSCPHSPEIVASGSHNIPPSIGALFIFSGPSQCSLVEYPHIWGQCRCEVSMNFSCIFYFSDMSSIRKCWVPFMPSWI